MLEFELQQYLQREYPRENARCEWKEFKNLKNSFSGDEKDDVISYVSAIANMEGGHLVIGVKDKTLEIVGTDVSRLTFNGHLQIHSRQLLNLRNNVLTYHRKVCLLKSL